MKNKQSICTFNRQDIELICENVFADGNNVQLFWRNEKLFEALFDHISSAKKIVCLEFYIFRNDETGLRISNLLKTKVKDGVKVYILYDHFGSFQTPRQFWLDMEKAGIEINTSNSFLWTAPFKYFRRNHKKLIIIDGKEAFIGGLNIADEYSGYFKRHKKAWRDTGISLEGPIAYKLLSEFNKSWISYRGKNIIDSSFSEEDAGTLPVIPIFANSGKGRRRFRKLLYYSIEKAAADISLTTAYFTPSKRMIYAFSRAVKRGVRVRLLLPSHSDVYAAHYAGKASYSRLLKSGVEIYNYEAEILHAKTSVFDGCWSIIGSANLDYRSLKINDEGNVGILNKNFGEQMLNVFDDDLKKSFKIETDKWSERGFIEKIKEKFFALFKMRL
ncbi:MAG: phospholipase D-like domain-containing protein [Nitrospiraceae bacterium]|nr:phospholipase D-like domain-containing protein [Nitrospiraceae bacterium]